MKNKPSFRGTGLSGAPSLVVIFGVLFLTILTVLTWERARTADVSSALTAKQTLSLAQAECASDEIIASIRCGEIPPSVTFDDGIYRFDCAVSETQTLEVALTVDENGVCTVLSRRLVTLAPDSNDL